MMRYVRMNLGSTLHKALMSCMQETRKRAATEDGGTALCLGTSELISGSFCRTSERIHSIRQAKDVFQYWDSLCPVMPLWALWIVALHQSD
jgi:hypothetical protein